MHYNHTHDHTTTKSCSLHPWWTSPPACNSCLGAYIARLQYVIVNNAYLMLPPRRSLTYQPSLDYVISHSSGSLAPLGPVACRQGPQVLELHIIAMVMKCMLQQQETHRLPCHITCLGCMFMSTGKHAHVYGYCIVQQLPCLIGFCACCAIRHIVGVVTTCCPCAHICWHNIWEHHTRSVGRSGLQQAYHVIFIKRSEHSQCVPGVWRVAPFRASSN